MIVPDRTGWFTWLVVEGCHSLQGSTWLCEHRKAKQLLPGAYPAQASGCLLARHTYIRN